MSQVSKQGVSRTPGKIAWWECRKCGAAFVLEPQAHSYPGNPGKVCDGRLHRVHAARGDQRATLLGWAGYMWVAVHRATIETVVRQLEAVEAERFLADVYGIALPEARLLRDVIRRGVSVALANSTIAAEIGMAYSQPRATILDPNQSL